MDNYEKVLASVKAFPEQITSSWDAINLMLLPEDFREANKIVITGMGGSALGGRVIKYVFSSSLTVPLEVVTGYQLPSYVDENTLVIASSYSGNTEETISAFDEALEAQAMVFVITTGGKLRERAVSEGTPAYLFEPTLNPAGQPRLATGYSIGALLGLLSITKFIDLEEVGLLDTIKTIKPQETNARTLSQEIKDKIPVLVASDHLLGAAHVVKNQLNESAKSFAALFDIPELNHHLMEGLVNPLANQEMLFILLESELYHERVKARYPLTKEVIEKNKIKAVSHLLETPTKLGQALELITLGSHLQVDLAREYKSDPMTIPWVDYFKEKLA